MSEGKEKCHHEADLPADGSFTSCGCRIKQPQYRPLGPDEVIQEGDKLKDGKFMRDCMSTIGRTAGTFPQYQFFRPIIPTPEPKREEEKVTAEEITLAEDEIQALKEGRSVREWTKHGLKHLVRILYGKLDAETKLAESNGGQALGLREKNVELWKENASLREQLAAANEANNATLVKLQDALFRAELSEQKLAEAEKVADDARVTLHWFEESSAYELLDKLAAYDSLRLENAALRKAVEPIMTAHDANAVACNFKQCGCDYCNALRAALTPTPK